MHCLNCHSENPAGFTFCGYCGSPLTRTCLCCGFDNDVAVLACEQCGADLDGLRLPSKHAAAEGERRFAVIMFADIAGFTRLSEGMDPEEVTWLVNRCLDEMSNAVTRYGGQVDKYIGDGLMGVFGAPVSHEDDPVRALEAGLVMRERIANLQLGPHISSLSLHLGVACGFVVAAEVGSRQRKEYTVIGSAVNLASHLEDASTPGQILVSPDVYRLVAHAFTFEPVTLSDFHTPGETLQAYELIEQRSGTLTTRGTTALWSPLVGRSSESATLGRCIEELRIGTGRIVSVIGEAGIGKSRLVDEVRRYAASNAPEVMWLEGQMPSHGESVSYTPFRDILRAAIGARPQMERDKVCQRLLGELDVLFSAGAPDVHPYLARLLGLDLEGPVAEQTRHLDGESLRRRMFQAMQDFVARLCTRQPVVLALEDLHWGDMGSMELLEEIALLVDTLPLMVVVVSRPRPKWAYERIRDIAGDGYKHKYTELWLRPLSEQAADELVSNLLGGREVPLRIRQLLLFRGGGNPLFIEELLTSMIDQGWLVLRNGAWAMIHAEEFQIPETVQGIIQARVDRLDEWSKRVLQVAACIGQRFPYDLLATTARQVGVSDPHFDESLTRLEDAALVQRESDWREGEYAFKHILIRDTVHNSLLKETRAQFHAAVAHWYEEKTLNDPEPPFALLAYHYEQTGNRDKQRHYFTQAGYQATRNHAPLEASSFFTSALALMEDAAQRFDLLLAREQVCSLIGDRVRQRADLDEALELAERQDNDFWRATVYNRLAAWHESQGSYPDVHAAAEKGLAAARRAHEAHAEAKSRQIIASAAWRQGRFAAALAAGQEALAAARAAHDPSLEAHSLTTMGVVNRSLGHLDAARACYWQALDIRRAIGDRRGEAISLSQLGNVFYDQGDYTRAFDHHQQALDLFRLVGDRQGEAWSLGGLGTVNLACGEYESARARFEEALDVRRAIGDRRGEAVAMSDLGNALLALGELELARKHLEQAVAITRDIGARRDEVHSLTYLACALEQLGDLQSAQEIHQAALSRRREQGQQAASLENVAGLGRIAQAQGDLGAARACANEIVAHIQSVGLANMESPFHIYQTCIHIFRACGNAEAAHATLQAAYTELMQWAERISDVMLRRAFLERIPEHREIIAEWEAARRI
ncbi:MAG: tetratricopeptide repeat protein [Anaerolineae bacterium]|nr:tetratricopeptide repeat protein [Anaerolineae bacterium]